MFSRALLPTVKQTLIRLIIQPFRSFIKLVLFLYRRFFHFKNHIECVNFGGYITRLEQTYILIDHHIYSTYGAFGTPGQGEPHQRFPRQGDYVEGEMKRTRSALGFTGGWIVVSARITTPPPDSVPPIPIRRGDTNPLTSLSHSSFSNPIPLLEETPQESSVIDEENTLDPSTRTTDPLDVPLPYYVEQFPIPATILDIVRQGERSILEHFPEVLQVI